MKKLISVVGTRPEAIKMCPLVIELSKMDCFDSKLLAVYQHKELLDEALDDFDVRPDIKLILERTTLSALVSDIVRGVSDVLRDEKPDALLVHGDTLTAAASALAAFLECTPIFHIEAGLRTYNVNSPYPEEFSRRLISLVAKLHFAPTEVAKKNLLREGVGEQSIFVTGNTVTDAIRYSLNGYKAPADDIRKILITCHRRENIGREMYEYLTVVRRVLEDRGDVVAILPIHPNPEVSRVVRAAIEDCEYFNIVPPMPMREFHRTMSRVELILTDSGGVQEEACALGIPTLVLRSATERPEGISEGVLRLCPDSETLEYELVRLLGNGEALREMRVRSGIYGDGYVSRRIAEIMKNTL